MKSLLFLGFLLLCWNVKSYDVENCSTTVPSGSNNAQPAIVLNTFIEVFTTIELGPETGARCLDGSNYKFYFTPGKGEGISKFMFYWQGAAFCGASGDEPLASCYERMSTQYGTSNSSYWGENGTQTSVPAAMGWFSSMEDYNPKFWNWNKVEIISCDGANHQGSLDDPVFFNGSYIYFRGFNNTMSTLQYLKENHNLFNATEIFLGGGSSGSTASIIWTSFLQDYFPKSIRLMGIPDAGVFVDSYSENNKCYLYRFFMQTLANALNLSTGVGSILYRRCKYRHTAFWKCMMVEYMYDTIDIPMFIINSQNDFKQLTNLNGLGCINLAGGLLNCNSGDRKKITKVREEFLSLAMKMKKDKPHWGLWLRTCFEHTYHFTWAWYGHNMDVYSAETGESSNIQDALYSWHESASETSRAPSYIDLLDWLHNPFCHYGPAQYDQAT